MVRDDQRWRGSALAAGLARDGAQRLPMQMIEVRVRYQDDVHRRQIAQVQSRSTQPLENEKPAREVGIDNDVLSANLQKETRVSNEGDAKLAVRNQFRFVGFASAWRNHRMPHQASELARALAQGRTFQ